MPRIDASFTHATGALGRFQIRGMRLPDDLALVHGWVTAPRAHYWGQVGQSPDQVDAAYREIQRTAGVHIGSFEGVPAFLLETYHPARDVVGQHYQVQPGDRGMHILIAPPGADGPRHGFTAAVFETVMAFLFSDPATARVVVEPDIRNLKIHRLNRQAGFRYIDVVRLPHKVAHLAFCTRAQHQTARTGVAPAPSEAAEEHYDTVGSLRPEVWLTVDDALVRKAISELSHERLLAPVLDESTDVGDWKGYRLSTERAGVVYQFRARLLPLEHWDIDAASLRKTASGAPAPLEAMELFLELRETLGLQGDNLPPYLEEIAGTLGAAAYKDDRQASTAADLVHAGFQEIEAGMTEGHPAFIANSGRGGFDAADAGHYAPEAAAPIHLIWLAAHRGRAAFSSTDDLPYQELVADELGDEASVFEATLARRGLDPGAYLFLPVHPWQWAEKLTTLFAGDLAAHDLVCLGEGRDQYRAQQSIRTLFNVTRPRARYVKTALSVLNMGFMRGLSADYMRGTPAICQWVDDLIARDPYFRTKGFRILREVAAVGYRQPVLEHALPKASPYRKMLAALWRESPVGLVGPGQRLMTMAALLHRDRDGRALVPQLILSSGLEIDAWLDRYLDAYLAPLLHCFYAHDLAFMPHGENVILVLEGNVPVGALLKDIAEEAAVMDPARPLPEQVRRLAVAVPDAIKPLAIFTDVFDGIFRYLSQILLEQGDYAPARFWQRVAGCVRRYAADQPHLADKLRQHDLFAPDFPHSCLNRLQLANSRHMLDLTDPAQGLKLAGSLVNPLACLDSLAPRGRN